jgi:uncharacterized YigZ family protein
MEQDTYKTIKQNTQGLFRDRGSKFLSFAFPVSNEDEIKQILEVLRKDYHDARHHCYAWVLGAQKENFRANDDGEPSGTGGRPVLGQIQKNELTDTLIVVIRYFGGILLGTGGLINAYRSAAADAIEQAEIVKRTVDDLFELSFPYTAMNDVMKTVKEEMAEQLEQDFDIECRLMVRLPRSRSERFTGRLSMIDTINIKKLSINC